jgi:hypothetical protein
MATEILTQARLKELLHYDPETGCFVWRVARSARAKAGTVAGSLWRGYVNISVDAKIYTAHRLAWLYVTGAWPTNVIDHINRFRSDNRWCNLRLSTQTLNAQNARLRRDNQSGAKGVSWHEGNRKWRARIQADKKQLFLGWFSTFEDAAAAYKTAARTLHPHANDQVPAR